MSDGETLIQTRSSSHREAGSTLLCALENGSNLHVTERQKIRHYCARSTEEEERRRMPKGEFFTLCGAHINCAIMAMLYTHSIGNQLYNTMVVFKIRDSVPSARYSRLCNVLSMENLIFNKVKMILLVFIICFSVLFFFLSIYTQ